MKKSKTKQNESVFDIIKQKKLSSLKRSHSTQDYLQQKGRQLSAVAKGGGIECSLPEHELSTLYYSMLDDYYHRCSYTTATNSQRSKSFWKRVAECKERSGVDSHTYLKAQFAWCDRHFGCPPSYAHLVTDNSIKRAIEFNGSLGKIVGAVPVRSELAEVLKHTDEQVRRICKAQNLTKEQFYEELVLTGNMILPTVYLDNDPVYSKVRRSKDK